MILNILPASDECIHIIHPGQHKLVVLKESLPLFLASAVESIADADKFRMGCGQALQCLLLFIGHELGRVVAQGGVMDEHTLRQSCFCTLSIK